MSHLSGIGIEYPSDVGVIHESQRLTLGFEAGDDPATIHSRLNDFQSHFASHGTFLKGEKNHAATALPQLPQ
jgi:hypothetical protein